VVEHSAYVGGKSVRVDPPNFGRLRDNRPRSRRETLDQLAQSDDPDVRRQVTWGMSAGSSDLRP